MLPLEHHALQQGIAPQLPQPRSTEGRGELRNSAVPARTWQDQLCLLLAEPSPRLPKRPLVPCSIAEALPSISSPKAYVSEGSQSLWSSGGLFERQPSTLSARSRDIAVLQNAARQHVTPR
mmetsp:Transcript_10962/g.29170  ORF Transcript_10962/g.29170 Transcript_10962/m.29170 type:complete len:121 (-) Transcript_10962:104-466(-)